MTTQKRQVVEARHLTEIGQAINDLTDLLFDTVVQAREQQESLTWDQIGDALGITRQAAWERFTQSRLRKHTFPIHPGQGVLV